MVSPGQYTAEPKSFFFEMLDGLSLHTAIPLSPHKASLEICLLGGVVCPWCSPWYSLCYLSLVVLQFPCLIQEKNVKIHMSKFNSTNNCVLFCICSCPFDMEPFLGLLSRFTAPLLSVTRNEALGLKSTLCLSFKAIDAQSAVLALLKKRKNIYLWTISHAFRFAILHVPAC